MKDIVERLKRQIRFHTRNLPDGTSVVAMGSGDCELARAIDALSEIERLKEENAALVAENATLKARIEIAEETLSHAVKLMSGPDRVSESMACQWCKSNPCICATLGTLGIKP